ncbi:hypothetical protein QL285_010365 [Trifolium repens]|nr:hypothetical protein QL285_010365 [Trifolium repens]
MNDPWLLAGDFNDIANAEEKKGGVIASVRKCNKFNERITACNLLDLGSMGHKYTWRGTIYHGGQRIYERLDRALSNEKWRVSFPDCCVKVLARVDFSDHHPLLIIPRNAPHPIAPRQFRFESAWLLESSYNEMIVASWKHDQSVPNNLLKVQNEVKKWRFDTFDQVLHKKKSIMARIDGIQRSIQNGSSARGNWKLERKLQNELREILKKEEMMWFQRSRAKWLIDGDQNTRYYHLKTINRRRKNNILMLKNSEGHWIEDVNEMHGMVSEFYHHLFSVDNTNREWFQTHVTYPVLDEGTLASLGAPIEDTEVKYVVQSMSPWKAPGPDGFPAGFY